jgi:hypothetical protein
MSVFRALAAARFSGGQLPVSELGLGDKIRVNRENIIYSGNLFMYLRTRVGFSPPGSCLKETQTYFMKTSENLQQCPAGVFFVWDGKAAAFSGPHRSRGARARDRRVGSTGF